MLYLYMMIFVLNVAKIIKRWFVLAFDNKKCMESCITTYRQFNNFDYLCSVLLKQKL